MTRTRPTRVAAHATPIPPVAYADAIAGAVAFLHAQLRNPDTSVGMTAAMALLDLEKTRMRHGQAVAGTVPHIAAGLPAGHASTEDAADSPPTLGDPRSPAGKPPALCDPIAAGSLAPTLPVISPVRDAKASSVTRGASDLLSEHRWENVRTGSPLAGHSTGKHPIPDSDE